MANDPLKFKVAPHIVEDLGLNLYTSLPRVLAEYVANAYDADSRKVVIQYDASKIAAARKVLKNQYQLDAAKAEAENRPKAEITPLEKRQLPEDISIVIEDIGHGMSRDDLNDKFLLAGRRRRIADPNCQGRTPNGRLLMGRKGIGKLAGFGVAKQVEVTTRKVDEPAVKIVLNFDELINKPTHEIPIDDEILEDGGGFEVSGTRIVLSRLLYGPTKSRLDTIKKELMDSFYAIKLEDFQIDVADETLMPEIPEYAFAWPIRDGIGHDKLVQHELPIGEDETESDEFVSVGSETIRFLYRIRFTVENKALLASKRGIRVYSNHRLAEAASLLDADTNMHGFRMVDYLDGVVEADFIDEQEADYISTDRQSLRWDTPLLSPLRKFLSAEIKEACKAYQKARDEESDGVVKEDEFTRNEIERFEFTKKDQRFAYRIAAALRSASKSGTNDTDYKEKLPILLQAIGHGSILTAITKLSQQPNPRLTSVISEIIRLTKDELEQFSGVVRGRIKGIQTLRKIICNASFRENRNEGEIQSLMEECPWLVDPTYTQFLLAADVSLNTVFKQLAEALGISSERSEIQSRREPDLVFLIGNTGLQRIVIVELKASNIPLEISHLTQLKDNMGMAKEWLESKSLGYQVFGHLIGTVDTTSQKKEVKSLRREMKEIGPHTMWKVRDYITVLDEAEKAHQELLDAEQSISNASSD